MPGQNKKNGYGSPKFTQYVFSKKITATNWHHRWLKTAMETADKSNKTFLMKENFIRLLNPDKIFTQGDEIFQVYCISGWNDAMRCDATIEGRWASEDWKYLNQLMLEK